MHQVYVLQPTEFKNTRAPVSDLMSDDPPLANKYISYKYTNVLIDLIKK